MVLHQNQKFVFKSVCIKGVCVTWGVSKQFILHAKTIFEEVWMGSKIGYAEALGQKPQDFTFGSP